MTNQKLKQEQFNKLLELFKHLEPYCTITARGLEDNSIYFHPVFKLSEEVYISAQSDIGADKNIKIYALKLYSTEPQFNVDIYEEILDAVVIGYFTNKPLVELALNTLSKIRDHENKIQMYTTDYINNLLVGESISELTKQFINELKSVDRMIEFLKTQEKSK